MRRRKDGLLCGNPVVLCGAFEVGCGVGTLGCPTVLFFGALLFLPEFVGVFPPLLYLGALCVLDIPLPMAVRIPIAELPPLPPIGRLRPPPLPLGVLLARCLRLYGIVFLVLIVPYMFFPVTFLQCAATFLCIGSNCSRMGSKRKLKILFICNVNRHRSVTAEEIFADRYETRSAGLYRNEVTAQQLEWADVIVTMTEEQRTILTQRFPVECSKKRLLTLDVDDTYLRGDPQLAELLEQKMKEALEGMASTR